MGDVVYRSRKQSRYMKVVSGTMTLSSFRRTAVSSSSVQIVLSEHWPLLSRCVPGYVSGPSS